MSKLLLLVLLGIAIYLFLRGMRRNEAPRQEPPSAPQSMVTCARCGVHQPVGESVLAAGHYYCCEQHRELGPAAPARKG